jgi:hypothetical protein
MGILIDAAAAWTKCQSSWAEFIAVRERVTLSEDVRANGEFEPKGRLSIEFCFCAPKQASVLQ